MSDEPIRAAGVVLLRQTSRGPQTLMVHRPRRKDWSLPKGKLDPGESTVAAAIRECDEETGIIPVLGVPLKRQSYQAMGRKKTVDYWTATIGLDNGFAPDGEVDEVRWASLDDARSRLSYARDAELVARAFALPQTWPLIILRHAASVKRGDFDGPDIRRPLTEKGKAEARGLIPLLAAYGVTHVHSSDALRCLETVRPYAEVARAKIEAEPLLSEAGYKDRPKSTRSRTEALAGERRGLAICSHRPVLPSMLTSIGALGKSAALKRSTRTTIPPGGMIVIHRSFGKRGWSVVAVERHEGPHLPAKGVPSN
ncbi:MAG: NUDIX hydrolase [Candidatus Nanopelagicales bacterium]|nr:NUDIX hydrolase [Candidatus Nanopelagicales bacterium]